MTERQPAPVPKLAIYFIVRSAAPTRWRPPPILPRQDRRTRNLAAHANSCWIVCPNSKHRHQQRVRHNRRDQRSRAKRRRSAFIFVCHPRPDALYCSIISTSSRIVTDRLGTNPADFFVAVRGEDRVDLGINSPEPVLVISLVSDRSWLSHAGYERLKQRRTRIVPCSLTTRPSPPAKTSEKGKVSH